MLTLLLCLKRKSYVKPPKPILFIIIRFTREYFNYSREVAHFCEPHLIQERMCKRAAAAGNLSLAKSILQDLPREAVSRVARTLCRFHDAELDNFFEELGEDVYAANCRWGREIGSGCPQEGLASACAFGKKKFINRFVLRGANNFDAGLLNAAAKGHIKIVRWMLELGAIEREHAFNRACYGGWIEIVCELFSPEFHLEISLYHALCGGHQIVINFLVQHVSPTEHAFEGCFYNGSEDLINSFTCPATGDFSSRNPGKKINGANRHEETFFETACDRGHLHLMHRFEQFDPNEGLYYAARSGHLHLVKYFVQRGATVFDLAMISGHEYIEIVHEMLAKLEQSGEPKTVQSAIDETFLMACVSGTISVVELLLSRTTKLHEGFTKIGHHAALVPILFKAGANSALKTYQIARKWGFIDVIRELQKCGVYGEN